MAIVSLRFNEFQDPAPYVDLNENDSLYERIIELAELHKIPVIEDSDLARSLMILDEGEYIPVPLYRAIAILMQKMQSLLT